MFARRVAHVVRVSEAGPQCEELVVLLDGTEQKALNYIPLSGPALAGDSVVVNTTAVELALGSGGYHFVYQNLNRPEHTLQGEGHIMKLRYTPLQMRVLAVEEEASPHHQVMMSASSLFGMPVVVAELHSMLAPVVLSIKKEKDDARLAYVMTDGGALPAFFSRTVRVLKERKLLCGTVTCGHAFGGDLEAVTIYSGLLAARHILKADAAVVCMGPGVAGTGTPYGFSGMEAGENVNRVHSLEGQAVFLPRLSFADVRSRHRGISHHTLTALTKAAMAPADFTLPVLPAQENAWLEKQLAAAGLARLHNVYRYDGLPLHHLTADRRLCSTMGRSLDDDPAFFLAAAAAGRHTVRLLSKSP
ncbi:MAG: DUF3866 family protein [Bacillota bacterium]|nr:DUF3866 family protein [Bacillota bacterium]MDW7684060.1 DUF3866 family protein [Bacillota bacterium]